MGPKQKVTEGPSLPPVEPKQKVCTTEGPSLPPVEPKQKVCATEGPYLPPVEPKGPMRRTKSNTPGPNAQIVRNRSASRLSRPNRQPDMCGHGHSRLMAAARLQGVAVH